MKKWFWAAPAAVFLISLGMVLYLNAKDVSPELLIGADGGPSWTALSETEALSLLEKNLSAFERGSGLPEGVFRAENGAFFLEEAPGGFVQAIVPEGVSLPAELPFLSGRVYHRSLPLAGWWYYVSYPLPLTQSGRYIALAAPFAEELGAMPPDAWVLVLAEKEGEAFPAERSKSAYVVKFFIPLENGETKTAYADPKQYAFLGFTE